MDGQLLAEIAALDRELAHRQRIRVGVREQVVKLLLNSGDRVAQRRGRLLTLVDEHLPLRNLVLAELEEAGDHVLRGSRQAEVVDGRRAGRRLGRRRDGDREGA